VADFALATVDTKMLADSTKFSPTKILPAKLGASTPYSVFGLSDFNSKL